MDPSSLIFLAIIAVWGAYLVGQWVRRRDQLATARSIDRFSQAMRVLERRTPTRPVSAARPTARSYVVAPVRVPAASASRASGPSGSRGAAHTSPGSRTSTPTAASHRTSTDATRSGAAAGATASPAAAHPRITREAARRRARVVLGLVVATVLAWTFAAATSLVWWPAALVTAALAVVLVQMRRTARPAGTAQRRPDDARSGQRLSTRRAVRRPAGRSSSRGRRGLASRVPAPARRPRHEGAQSVLDKVDAARRSQAELVASPAVRTGTVRTGTGTGTGRTGTVLAGVDQDRTDADPAEASVAAARAAASTDGWQPVPVPPPTYTLKPKARPVVRRPVESADLVDEVEDVAAPDSDHRAGASGGQRDDVRPVTPRAPEPAAPAFDLDEILERRIASGG